jgi:vacuolar-type H+-ATPase subunit E/Vma4
MRSPIRTLAVVNESPVAETHTETEQETSPQHANREEGGNGENDVNDGIRQVLVSISEKLDKVLETDNKSRRDEDDNAVLEQLDEALKKIKGACKVSFVVTTTDAA